MNDFGEQEAEFPEEVCQPALLLHKERSESLSTQLPAVIGNIQPNRHWTQIGEAIEYSSLGARNYCTAIQSYREFVANVDSVSEAKLFDVAYDLWRDEIGRDDLASGRFLALAANRYNILQVAAGLISTNTKPVFDVLHVIEAALKYLPEMTVEDLCAIADAQHPKTEQDLARGLLFVAIEEALVEKPDLAWELYRHVKAAPSASIISLFTSALMGLARVGQLNEVAVCAISDAETEDELLVQAADWVISRLIERHSLPKDLLDRCILSLRNNSYSPNEDIRYQAIHCISLAAAKESALLDDLIEHASKLDPKVLSIVVNHLFMNEGRACSYKILPELLDCLVHLPVEMDRAIRDLDAFLSHLLQKGDDQEELVLRYLQMWLVIHGNESSHDKESIQLFSQTIMAVHNKPALLQKVITKWLIADEQKLASACSAIISFLWVRGYKTPSFSADMLGEMDSASLIHLVRRMLGYVYSEDALLSFTFSMLDVNDAQMKTYQIVHSLLVKEVGRNYIESTLEAIQKKMGSAQPPLNAMLESAFAQLNTYRTNIESLPRLQELRPPFQLRRAIALRRSREMRESMDAATEKSVFLKLVKQVPLKAGIGSFTVKDGRVGETHHLQSMSHAISLPRRHMSDPVGYVIEGLLFRTAKRGDE